MRFTFPFYLGVAVSCHGRSIFVSRNNVSAFMLYSNDSGETFHEFGFVSNWGQLSCSPDGDVVSAANDRNPSSSTIFAYRSEQWIEVARQTDFPGLAVGILGSTPEETFIELSMALQGYQSNNSMSGNETVSGGYKGSHQTLTTNGIVLVCISFLGIALLFLSVIYYFFRDKGLLRYLTCSRFSSGGRPFPVADVERVQPSVCVSVSSAESEDLSNASSAEIPTADATQLTGIIPVDKAAKLESWKAEGALSDVEYIIARRILTNESGINGSFMRDLRHAVHSHKAGDISDRDFLLAKSRILLSMTASEDYEIDLV